RTETALSPGLASAGGCDAARILGGARVSLTGGAGFGAAGSLVCGAGDGCGAASGLTAISAVLANFSGGGAASPDFCGAAISPSDFSDVAGAATAGTASAGAAGSGAAAAEAAAAG